MTHELEETSVKPCNLCPEKFMLKSSGNSRLCIHLEKKPFKCEACEKSFSTKQTLRYRQYMHTGYPYICETCDKGFRLKALLKLHHHSHSEEMSFLCEICDKEYTTKAGLQAHTCIHRDMSKRLYH